jgi:hypothetical protein
MPVATEISLRLPNSPGALAEVCAALATERVTIEAMTLGADGVLRLVVDNPLRADGALREQRHELRARDVLVTAVAPGPDSVAVLRLLATAGVNVDYAYAAAGARGGGGTMVIAVDDPLRAATAAGV